MKVSVWKANWQDFNEDDFREIAKALGVTTKEVNYLISTEESGGVYGRTLSGKRREQQLELFPNHNTGK